MTKMYHHSKPQQKHLQHSKMLQSDSIPIFLGKEIISVYTTEILGVKSILSITMDIIAGLRIRLPKLCFNCWTKTKE